MKMNFFNRFLSFVNKKNHNKERAKKIEELSKKITLLEPVVAVVPVVEEVPVIEETP